MHESPDPPAVADRTEGHREAQPVPAASALRRRLRLLQWVVPLGLLATVLGLELGPLEWVRNYLGEPYHLLAEVIAYGTVGPAIAFLLLDLLGRWLEERETSQLQSRLLARARQQVEASHQLADSVMQHLFAVSMQLDAIEADWDAMPPEARAQLRAVRKSLDYAARQLRDHLLGTTQAPD